MSYTPSWYDPTLCGQLRLPDLDRAAQAGAEYAAANGITKSQQWQNDNPSIVLSVIDAQNDFILPNGALSVPGAVEDTDRLNRFIYDNVGGISHILASLDTHYLFQPFHRFNWRAGPKPTSRADGSSYAEGDHPDPFTVITLQDVQDGAWVALRHPKQMLRYLKELEQTAKKQLCIWPIHCVLGTTGHAWESTFAEAIFFHAGARNNQYDATTKGMSQLSEHYGILQAEVQFPEDPNTNLNTRVVSKWEQADLIYFAGQAETHCDLETFEQIIAVFQSQGKNHLLEKMRVLKDCMSPVPDIELPDGSKIEFHNMAQARFAEMERDHGIKFVNSTDPIG